MSVHEGVSIIKEKHQITFTEMQDAIEIVKDLLGIKVNDLYTNQPYARKAIKDINMAISEVSELNRTIYE